LTVHSRPLRPAWRSRRMTGSAVVTTRLSRVVMKRATEVIAKVQMVAVRELMSSSLPLVVTDHLLPGEKKSGSLRRNGGLEEAPGPGGVLVQEVHRGEDVEEHPEGEEVADALGVSAREVLHVLDEQPVA